MEKFPGRWEVEVTNKLKYSKDFSIQVFYCLWPKPFSQIGTQNGTKAEIFKIFSKPATPLFLDKYL